MKRKRPRIIIEHIGEPISQCPPPESYDCDCCPQSCDNRERCLYVEKLPQNDYPLVEAVHFLQGESEQAIFEIMNPKLRENGFIAADGRIMYKGRGWMGSFISGLAIAGPTDDKHAAACSIVNTINDGPHYATIDPDTMGTKDLGPVVTPTIVGNVSKPYGLYIPFNNIEAIEQGTDFCLDCLTHLYEKRNEKSIDDNLSF